MRSIQPPRILADLGRDLRDRGLVVPAIVLLVALVAVPIVLTTSPAAPPPAPDTGEPEATAATPAVLAEGPEVRDYRKRLEALKRKNPFDQKFTVPEPGAADITEPGGSASPGGLQGPSPQASEPNAPDPGDGGREPASAEPGDGSTAPSPPEQKTKRFWYAWEANLTFGEAGSAKRYRGVGALRMLPRPKQPVVVMLGAGPNGKRAAFMMPGDLVDIDKGGGCAPSKAECSILQLRPGDQRRFTVDDGGGPVHYRLKLLSIESRIIRRSSE